MGWRRAREEEPGTGSMPGWGDVFTGDTSREAYQRALRAHTSVTWYVVESGHDDLLRLLVGKVPADLGVTVILGISVLFAPHQKGADAGRALLATALSELAPHRARTLLVTLADAWHNAELHAFDQRSAAIGTALQQALRRLAAADLPETEREALHFIGELVAQTTT
jgi:hypothetical protein